MNLIDQSNGVARNAVMKPGAPLVRASMPEANSGVFISSIRPANGEEWDSIWKECSYSTYFHSREWAEIWKVYTKGAAKPVPLLITFSDGRKALLPLSAQKSHKGIIQTHLSSPAGTFGGWISTDTLGTEHAVPLCDFLTRKLGDFYWRVNPYDPLARTAGLRANHDDETQVFDLRSGFDALCKTWSKEHGSAFRKARREGVAIRQANSLEDWREYYASYEDSLRRWAEKTTSRYSWELFNEIFHRRSVHVKLWVAVYQKRIIAGSLCFYAPRHVVYWHGAAFSQYFSVRPVDLLVFEMVKDACEKGYDWFDFNPSGGHQGVKAFKRSFGALSLSAPVFHREGKITQAANWLSNMSRRVRA